MFLETELNANSTTFKYPYKLCKFLLQFSENEQFAFVNAVIEEKLRISFIIKEKWLSHTQTRRNKH